MEYLDKAAVVAPVIEKVPVATESDKESDPVVVADVKASVVVAVEKDNPKVTSKVSDESVKVPVVKESVKASSVVVDKPSSVVADKVDVVKDNINVVADKVIKENVLSVVADKASNINVVASMWLDCLHVIHFESHSKSMFDGTLASFNAKWKSFSNQVNAQFKGNKGDFCLESHLIHSTLDLIRFTLNLMRFTLNLILTKTTAMTILDNSQGTYDSKYKEVCDLKKLFARHLKQYGHIRHTLVAKVKHTIPKLKWKTKEHFHDYGIFTMLHMETFDGEPTSNLDCGLPVESQLQRDMLRRLRFKFATKILLHEINVHARKMLELAKEFDKTDPSDNIVFTVLVSSYEGDAQLAYMFKKGMIDVAIFDDSDLIPYRISRSKSMFGGTLASFDTKWESFSNQVNAQFKGNKDGLALRGIDLVFFPICKSEHFYAVVFSLTKTTAMTILDNSPGTYDSQYKEVCDLFVTPDLWLDANVIDCWGTFLNHEEGFRAAESKSKHFFPTGCISKSIFGGTLASFDTKWESFSNQVNAQFKGNKGGLALRGIDLVFFPICKSEHFYVVVFSLTKTTVMTILDNSPGTYDSKYKEVCDLLYGHIRHTQVAKVKHTIPELKWKSKENFHDCRIFTVLHMETFDDGHASNLDCELPVES
nr:hypothetical protein [Tanacetum cinerariifolium]